MFCSSCSLRSSSAAFLSSSSCCRSRLAWAAEATAWREQGDGGQPDTGVGRQSQPKREGGRASPRAGRASSSPTASRVPETTAEAKVTRSLLLLYLWPLSHYQGYPLPAIPELEVELPPILESRQSCYSDLWGNSKGKRASQESNL